MTGYVRRKIDVSITLGKDNFTGKDEDTVTVSGLRVSCVIVKAGGGSQSSAQLRIYGMSLSVMNDLSTLGLIWGQVPKNTISISAGDDETGMGVVFQGTIYEAWVDTDGMPEVAFQVMAYAGLAEAMRPVSPKSYKGSINAQTVLSGMAAQAGLAFENNGVDVIFTSSYFPGTVLDQIDAAAKEGRFNYIVDNGKLAIWPRGGSRGGLVPLVSPETGLVGYPSYTSQGIMITTLYNPAIGFASKIEVKSSFKPACGTWIVQKLEYMLDSETPGGAWFTRLAAGRPGSVVIR